MLITADRLNHRYQRGGELIVSELTHEFRPGTFTAVTGPSGSGKSTLMYLLALMLTPTGGAIRWDGRDVQALPDSDRSALRARHVGFVFQDAVLDPASTALDNVLEAAWLSGMPSRAARRSAQDLMERFGVADRATHRPGEISGGQAQRIALCRALVKEPTVVFADEPTGNLDPDSAETVWRALVDTAATGTTVIAATHDLIRAHHSPNHLTLASAQRPAPAPS